MDTKYKVKKQEESGTFLIVLPAAGGFGTQPEHDDVIGTGGFGGDSAEARGLVGETEAAVGERAQVDKQVP